MVRRKFKINLEELSEGYLIPAAKYVARLVEVIEEPSKKGFPMFTWTWNITVGSEKGREIKTWTSLQDHALFGLAGHLKAFGLSGDIEFDTDEVAQFVGRELRLTVVNRPYTNPETNETRTVHSVSHLDPLRDTRNAEAAPSEPPGTFNEDEIPF